MSDYTPTTERVKSVFCAPFNPMGESDEGVAGEEFDRWLAAHDAHVKAQALRDAAMMAGYISRDGIGILTVDALAAWLTKRADRIEKVSHD